MQSSQYPLTLMTHKDKQLEMLDKLPDLTLNASLTNQLLLQ